jgi:hypothetical protein
MNRYYYLANICINKKDIEERDPIFSEAGGNRALYIAKSIGKEIEIVSFGRPKNKGYFKRVNKQITDKISIVYLSALNINFLRYIYSILELFFYLLPKIKYGDKVIVYNCDFSKVVSLILVRIIKNFDIILEIEEFYSTNAKPKILQKIYRYLEMLIIKKTDYFIFSNRNTLNRIKSIKKTKTKIKYLISFGYSDDKIIKILTSENNPRPFILYSGRNDYHGGFDILLESLKYIDIKLNLIITGKNFEGLNFEKYETKFVNIENKGFLKKKDYEILLRKANLCINPLRSKCDFARFSFPSKIIQYLRYGNIVVSSEIEAINQLGILRKYVFTYPKDDPVLLSTIIKKNYKKRILESNIIDDFNKFFDNKTKELKDFFKEI